MPVSKNFKRFAIIVNRKQRLSEAFYNKLIEDDEIPTKMKKLVKEYKRWYKQSSQNLQSGGACTQGQYILGESLGAGAYGEVFAVQGDGNIVIKAYFKKTQGGSGSPFANFDFDFGSFESTCQEEVINNETYKVSIPVTSTKTPYSILDNVDFFLNNANQSILDITPYKSDSILNDNCVSQPNASYVSYVSYLKLTRCQGSVFSQEWFSNVTNVTNVTKVIDLIKQFNENAGNAINFLHADMKYENVLYKGDKFFIHDIDGCIGYDASTLVPQNPNAQFIITPEFTHPLYHAYVLATGDNKASGNEAIKKEMDSYPVDNTILVWRFAMTGALDARYEYAYKFYTSIYGEDEETSFKLNGTVADFLKMADIYSFVLSCFFYYINNPDENLKSLLRTLYRSLNQNANDYNIEALFSRPEHNDGGRGRKRNKRNGGGEGNSTVGQQVNAMPGSQVSAYPETFGQNSIPAMNAREKMVSANVVTGNQVLKGVHNNTKKTPMEFKSVPFSYAKTKALYDKCAQFRVDQNKINPQTFTPTLKE